MKCKNILIKKSFFVEIDIIIFRWKISAIRRCSVSYIHVCLFLLFCFSDMLEKTADTWMHHHWFPCEMATRLCVVQEIYFNQSDALPRFG